eukprot:scaffold582_cov385-Prasinococcus_capsulatus_cf.AAC.37
MAKVAELALRENKHGLQVEDYERQLRALLGPHAVVYLSVLFVLHALSPPRLDRLKEPRRSTGRSCFARSRLATWFTASPTLSGLEALDGITVSVRAPSGQHIPCIHNAPSPTCARHGRVLLALRGSKVLAAATQGSIGLSREQAVKIAAVTALEAGKTTSGSHDRERINKVLRNSSALPVRPGMLPRKQALHAGMAVSNIKAA